jgi:hypothetical protein
MTHQKFMNTKKIFFFISKIILYTYVAVTSHSLPADIPYSSTYFIDESQSL